ncbi:MAG: hypothetical protein OHK0045_22010 [Raineya sp.]
MKKSLVEISENYRSLLSLVEELDGELTPEIEDSLKISQEEYAHKAEAYIFVIKDKEARIAEAQKMIEHCKKVIAREEKQISFLKTSLLRAVQVFGKIVTPLFSLSKRKSISVEIVNLDILPKKYIQKQEIFTIDKKLIKEALTQGKTVLGAELRENESLQIS